MTAAVVFRRAAQAEFDAAALRYDMQRPGLGAQFLSEIDHLRLNNSIAEVKRMLATLILKLKADS